jgi:hypothetical protein
MVFFLSFSSCLVFADANEMETQNNTYTSQNGQNDITKPGFKIDLQKMNPVQASQANSNTPTGKSAAEFLLNGLAKLLLFLIPLIAGVSFIIAGYYYVLSGGDSEKASQAKTIIKWNIIAIIVALFSYALVKMVSTVLGGSL